jgi:tetratricopeptide (TPR) repeat protein
MRWSKAVVFARTLQVGALLLSVPSFAKAPIFPDEVEIKEIENKEEAFLIRRIAEYWKDQDHKVVKQQIVEFLSAYPKSKVNDYLRGILGDLYLQEDAFEEALNVYKQIRNTDVLSKVVINKLQCYYELNAYAQIIKEGSPYLDRMSADMEPRANELRFLVAESYFREASNPAMESKKGEYLSKAKPIYEKLIETSFADPSMFALAEIYRIQNDHHKAASFFTELSKRHPEQEEELLFHAALAQSEFDRTLAIQTFTKIAEKNGLKGKDAELNRSILLFQEERYQEVINLSESLQGSVAPNREAIFYYMLGRSHFAKDNFEKASEFLNKYAAIADSSAPELKYALLMQLSSAQNLRDEKLYDEALSSLKNRFPEEKELPQAKFIHAMMLKERGDFHGAEQKLAEIIHDHLNFEDLETLYLEYSLITFQNGQWGKSRSILVSFLKEFPKSTHANIAWKYFLSSSLNLLKESEINEKGEYTKAEFYKDLSLVLEKKSDILTANEKKECLLLKGKIAYELARYDQAVIALNIYLAEYGEDPSASEAHLLVALCHHKLNGEAELFCKHAETALDGSRDLFEKPSIHLELYNAYLSLIDGLAPTKSSIYMTDRLYEKAAEHLFTAMQLQEFPVKVENRIWLANYYYEKSVHIPLVYEIDGGLPDSAKQEAFERSYSLLKELVQNKENSLISLSANEVSLEWEVLKLSNMLGRKGDFTAKIALLQNLIEQQADHSEWKWKLKKETLIELAKSYELTNRKEDAFDTFRFIASQYEERPSFVSEYSYLHALRLKFALMPSEQKVADNSEVFKVLNDLKEFQIRKSVSSEPLHLDAALEYASIRAEIAEPDEKVNRYMFFLGRIKEDFESQSDPMVLTYKNELNGDNAKDALFNQYMQFIDAELVRVDALKKMKENKTMQAADSTEQAKELLERLSKKSTSYYLTLRINKSLDALNKATLY